GEMGRKGTVEVFYRDGNPKAKCAYAWTYRDGDQNKTIPVLGIPPVDSPQSSVKVAIASRGVLISQQRKSRMRDKKKKTKKQIKSKTSSHQKMLKAAAGELTKRRQTLVEDHQARSFPSGSNYAAEPAAIRWRGFLCMHSAAMAEIVVQIRALPSG